MSLEAKRDRLVLRWRGAKYEWLIEPRYWRNPLIYSALIALLPVLVYYASPSLLPTVISANLLAAVAIPVSWMTVATGRVNFGPQFFVGAGGYIAALLSVYYGFGPLQTLPVAILGSLALGFTLSPLSIISRGLYYTLLTMIFPLVFLEITYIYTGIFKGDVGLSGITPLLTLGSATLTQLATAFLSLAMMGAYLWIVDKILRSRYGLAMAAINDDEEVAEAIGVNINKIKIRNFAFSACLVGAVGWFFAHYHGTFAGVTYLPLTYMIKILLAIIIGGRAQIYGCVVGAYFITFLELLLIRNLGGLSPVILPIVLLALLVALNEGLFGIYRKRHYREYLPTLRVRR